jgi:hypothetical protein
MPTPTDILWLAVLPAIVAALAMLATRPWRRGRDLSGLGATAAIVAGFGLAYYGQWRLPEFPPPSAQGWLFYLGIPVLIVAIVQALVKSDIAGAVLSCLVLFATPVLLLKNQRTNLGPEVFWTWVIGGGLAMVLWWLAMEPLARRGRGGSIPLALAMVAGVCGISIMNANSQTAGRVAGSIAVPLVVIALAGFWSKGRVVARGGTLAIGVLMLGMLLFAYHFAPDSMPYVFLLPLAPLALWAGEMRGLGDRDSWTRVAVRWVAVIAVLALPAFAAARGLQQLLKEQQESYQYY